MTLTDSVVSNNVVSSNRSFSFGGIANIHSESLPGATVALTNTTVSGNTPGGIFSTDGAITLTNSTLSANLGTDQNTGVSIQSQGGTLTVTGGTISGNGRTGIAGGFGTPLAVTNATVSGNAGGINQQGGTLTVTGSTISGNTAYDGVRFSLQPGEVNGPGSVTNSTFGGNGGTGLANSGTLTVTNSTFTGNLSGGIFNGGTLTLTGSIISGNNGIDGGGIYNFPEGTITVVNSAISGNTAGRFGGGITNTGTAVVTGSTISGNSAQTGGGSCNNGTLTLTNSTLSGNTASDAGGGLFNSGSSLRTIQATLAFVTVTGNAAGNYGSGIITTIDATTLIGRSIVVGNRRGNEADDCATNSVANAPLTSQGDNVFGVAARCPTNGAGDLAVEDAAAVLNPALAANGGPTKTHALVAGSPALNRVPAANCAAAAGVDQRGAARPQGAACDSGAYESGGTPPPVGLALTLTVVSGGQVQLAPPGTVSGGGTFPYTQGTVVTLTPQPGAGQTFTGWLFDGAYRGWAAPLTLTMDASHSVQATFAPTKTFPDVPGNRADFVAITELASRTTIRGYANGNYGPDDGVQRAQMAALIARATSAGPGTPTGGTLTPPACLAAGTWDCEDWGNGFSDRNGLDANLWRNVGALQHYQVAFGYDGAACAARGVAPPCYAPTAPVSYVETIVFITRAMVAKGYWVMQPNTPQPYTGVPAVFGPTVATYQFYTAGAGGVQAAPGDWNAGSTRGWFARALWQALNTYWATDGQLPDGRNAGGFVP